MECHTCHGVQESRAKSQESEIHATINPLVIHETKLSGRILGCYRTRIQTILLRRFPLLRPLKNRTSLPSCKKSLRSCIWSFPASFRPRRNPRHVLGVLVPRRTFYSSLPIGPPLRRRTNRFCLGLVDAWILVPRRNVTVRSSSLSNNKIVSCIDSRIF